jgi:hypothetical protein
MDAQGGTEKGATVRIRDEGGWGGQLLYEQLPGVVSPHPHAVTQPPTNVCISRRGKLSSTNFVVHAMPCGLPFVRGGEKIGFD